MLFEVEGERTVDGSRVKAHVKAESLRAAVQKATDHGVLVEVARPVAGESSSNGGVATARTSPRGPTSGGRVQGQPVSERFVAGTSVPGVPTFNPGQSVAPSQRSVGSPPATSGARWVAVAVALFVGVGALATFGPRVWNAAPPSSSPARASVAEEAPQAPVSAAPAIQALPPNVVRADDGKLTPAPGYDWVSATEGQFDVRWVPGRRHPSFAKISASQTEGRWVADAGYQFVKEGSGEVRWTPGVRVASLPDITAADAEGTWLADPGYEFPSKDSLTVRWSPGRAHSKISHLVAGPAAGNWHPAPGYRWVRPEDSSSMEVLWAPNIPHSSFANVISGSTEGKWRPASGYRFASDRPEDWTVVRVGPSDEQVKSALAKVLIALVSHEAAQPKESDGLGEVIVREFARKLRDEAIKSSLTDLFPGERPAALNAAANLIILGAEGRLTADNWLSQNTKDALVERLRKQDPAAADAEGLAEFVGRVIDSYDARRR